MKIKLFFLALSTVLLLSACSDSEPVSEGVPAGFQIVSKQKIGVYRIKELRHIKTGNHYIVTSGSGTALTPMFIEKNGVTVPYHTDK